MTSKAKTKQEEALQFLDDLDSMAPPPGAAAVPSASAANDQGEAEEVLAFLDEITQKSSEPTRATPSHLERPASRSGTPTLRKSTERVKLGGGSSSLSLSSSASASTSAAAKAAADKPKEGLAPSSDNSWGWGTMWSTASAALQHAKSAVDEQVKALPRNEQARKWGEGVIEYAKSAQFDKISQDFKRVGLSTLNDILNVVAPPISEHEVIQIWLSHEMQGYDGVESLVYRALARVMEQVEGGDLVVNRGNESKPKSADVNRRDLHAVEGYDQAYKLAQADTDESIKARETAHPKTSSAQSPTTYSDVSLRIQPFFTIFNIPTPPANQSSSETSTRHLQFLIYLVDPQHKLVHSTITQAVPQKWLDLWDQNDWVEDLVAEALRVGVEVVGQEYIVSRMGWGQDKKTSSASTSRQELEDKVHEGEDDS